ncbi:MAG: tripartite tricarboxylate transporter TctB family protein [Armatimonadota bacterium]
MGRDGIVGLLLLALSGWLYLHTRGIPRPPFVPLGPEFYPQLLLGIVAVLSAALVITDLRGRRVRRSRGPAVEVCTPGAPGVWLRQQHSILLIYLLFGAYAALMPVLGFRATTAGFVALLVWLLGQRTLRQIPIALITGLATALLTHAVFEGYLRILLPRGRLL